jgi:DNA polymerase I-like protein with 3'-5' exonuclease and polymerase domains
VAKLCEPKWPWVGKLAADREIAERNYYRHHSLRKLCKIIGHGTNFGGRPATLDAQTKIGVNPITQFQHKYFSAFPSHQAWHANYARELASTGKIISMIGQRKRQFWGRRGDQDTLREALAFEAQADEAHIVNTGMMNVWKARDAQLLLHCHDALVVQYPEKREDEVIPKLLAQLRIPIELRNGRQFVVPFGCKTGWNWGEHSEENPDGLKEYRPNDKRARQPQPSILDYSFRKPVKPTRVSNSVP